MLKPKASTGSALDGLLWDGQIAFHQHAAALAYAKLRRKAKGLGYARMRGLETRNFIAASLNRANRST